MQLKSKGKYAMNGKSYFLDTNTIIQLLKGNPSLIEILQEADYIACSIISTLEYLCFEGLSQHDITLFNSLLKKIEVIELTTANEQLIHHIINLRKEKNIKLPDAIITGSSQYKECILLTADKKLFNTVKETALSYQVI